MTNVEQRNNQYHQIYKENNETCIPNVDKSTLDIFHLSMAMEADLFYKLPEISSARTCKKTGERN